jgi:hypothetical protein
MAFANHALGQVEQKRKEKHLEHQRWVIGRTPPQSLPIIDADESLGRLLPIKELPKKASARSVIPSLRSHDISAFVWNDLFYTILCHPCRGNHAKPSNFPARPISQTFSAPSVLSGLTAPSLLGTLSDKLGKVRVRVYLQNVGGNVFLRDHGCKRVCLETDWIVRAGQSILHVAKKKIHPHRSSSRSMPGFVHSTWEKQAGFQQQGP